MVWAGRDLKALPIPPLSQEVAQNFSNFISEMFFNIYVSGNCHKMLVLMCAKELGYGTTEGNQANI